MEKNNTRRGVYMVCQYCGKEITGRKRKYCDIECGRNAHKKKLKDQREQKKVTKTCRECGKAFVPKMPWGKFCCDRCRDKYKRQHPNYPSCICKHCGKEYVPKSKERTTYCSRECAFEHMAAKPKDPGVIINYCVCGEIITPKHKYCDECRKESKRIRVREAAKQKHTANVKPKICKQCGTGFIPEYGTKRRSFCSDICLLKYSRKQGKRKRKAVLKQVKHVAYSDMYIFKRDKWICQICGKKVNPKYVGNHPLAPSIDHIIPISLGGADAPYNVQLAHRDCNRIKSNRLYNDRPEQIMLFG